VPPKEGADEREVVVHAHSHRRVVRGRRRSGNSRRRPRWQSDRRSGERLHGLWHRELGGEEPVRQAGAWVRVWRRSRRGEAGGGAGVWRMPEDDDGN
jgi:hypothetical protein